MTRPLLTRMLYWSVLVFLLQLISGCNPYSPSLISCGVNQQEIWETDILGRSRVIGCR